MVAKPARCELLEIKEPCGKVHGSIEGLIVR